MVVDVKTSKGGYKVIIENNILSRLQEEIIEISGQGKIFVVTDSNVDSIYGKKIKETLDCFYYVLPFGEHTKSHKYLMELYEQFLKAGLTRDDTVVAFGGGVIGDLTGFACATYLRGIKYVGVPTTLLSQVDSSVGGKVAVNLPQGKNLVGNFYPPSKVIIDPEVLSTLPKRVFSDGMAEVIKYGAIKDKDLFMSLFEDDIDIAAVIKKCVEIKRDIVENDEFDKGERMILNFGHTYGHAVECYYNYDKYTHGEGVATGMLYITEISEKMGITKAGTYQLIKNLCEKYNLYFPEATVPEKDAKEIIKKDKKATTDGINYIVLEELGKAIIKKEIL